MVANLCGWQGNHRSGVAMAMRHRPYSISAYGLKAYTWERGKHPPRLRFQGIFYRQCYWWRHQTKRTQSCGLWSQEELWGPDSPPVRNCYVNEQKRNPECNNTFVAEPSNEAPHERDMSARPNPTVRQWRRPRKSHDSDMLLASNGPQLKRAKRWWGISSYQRASGASRRAGGEIPKHFVVGKFPSTLYGKKPYAVLNMGMAPLPFLYCYN